MHVLREEEVILWASMMEKSHFTLLKETRKNFITEMDMMWEEESKD